MSLNCSAYVVGNQGYWGSKLYSKALASPYYETVFGYDNKHDIFQIPAPEKYDIVIIATPTETHFDEIMRWLNSVKNINPHQTSRLKTILVEKPATQSSRQMEEVLELANQLNINICIDHTFLFDTYIRTLKTPQVQKLLGNTTTLRLERFNLGKFNSQGVIWDLAPHDLAILDYLFGGEEPEVLSVVSQSTGHKDPVIVHTSDITLLYKTYIPVTLSLSWLFPKKVRRTTIVGTQGMAVYDMLSETPLVLTDKTALPAEKEWHHNYKWDTVYKAPAVEPLMCMLNELALFTMADGEFISDGQQGLRVVRTIERIIEQQKIIN